MVDLVVDCAEDRKESRTTPGLQGWGLGKLELMPCSVLFCGFRITKRLFFCRKMKSSDVHT